MGNMANTEMIADVCVLDTGHLSEFCGLCTRLHSEISTSR